MESKLIREGRIPEKGILRMENYKFFMPGDFLFVTIMDYAIVYLVAQGWPLSVDAVVTSASLVFVWTMMWHSMWMGSRHRPDSFYPRAGMVSLLGKIHLVYFAAQYLLGAMGLWMIGYMMAGLRPWSWVVALCLVSAAAYYVTLGSDLLAGRFKKPANPRG